MNAVDYILDGLEKELELERELGVRAVEFDRSLLAAAGGSVRAPNVADPSRVGATSDGVGSSRALNVADPSRVDATSDGVGSRRALNVADPSRVDATGDVRRETRDGNFDFLFLHDRALSPKGVEMIAKIVVALGRTAETAPVVIVPPMPKAKVYVVLGGLALKKFFPVLKGGPGQWLKTESGADVLVTYSPEYILRFPTVTPAVMKMKKDMWASLKSVLHRI